MQPLLSKLEDENRTEICFDSVALPLHCMHILENRKYLDTVNKAWIRSILNILYRFQMLVENIEAVRRKCLTNTLLDIV